MHHYAPYPDGYFFWLITRAGGIGLVLGLVLLWAMGVFKSDKPDNHEPFE